MNVVHEDGARPCISFLNQVVQILKKDMFIAQELNLPLLAVAVNSTCT